MRDLIEPVSQDDVESTSLSRGMDKLSSSPSATVRILVADDVEPWRELVCSTLRERRQLRVVGEVADGLEAVQRARDLQPDLILLDIGLPKLNGIEAASQIGQVAPGSKILFLTLYADVDVARAALSNGAKGYILKSDAAKELMPAIEAALRGEKFVSRRLNAQDSN
jgi:DNA-binding NarL/FixJ family response regulator